MKNSSDWDKYAYSEVDAMTKVASIKTAEISDQVFNDEIEEKMNSGMTASEALPMTIAERMFSIPWKLAQISNDMLDVARDLSDKDPAISERLYEFADTIRQESLSNYRDCLI